jgi:hypothetical protein
MTPAAKPPLVAVLPDTKGRTNNMADHTYNDPNLSPRAFLEAVRGDPTARLKHRIEAAKLLAQFYSDVLPQVVIRIGGFPQYDHDAEPCVDINDCIHRTTPCPWADIIRSIQGVRFHSCKDYIEKNSQLN